MQVGKALRTILRVIREVTAKIWRGGTEYARAGRLPLSLVDNGEPLGEGNGTWKKLTEVTHFDCPTWTRVQE